MSTSGMSTIRVFLDRDGIWSSRGSQTVHGSQSLVAQKEFFPLDMEAFPLTPRNLSRMSILKTKRSSIRFGIGVYAWHVRGLSRKVFACSVISGEIR